MHLLFNVLFAFNYLFLKYAYLFTFDLHFKHAYLFLMHLSNFENTFV
jgi:hypothetical protein